MADVCMPERRATAWIVVAAKPSSTRIASAASSTCASIVASRGRPRRLGPPSSAIGATLVSAEFQERWSCMGEIDDLRAAVESLARRVRLLEDHLEITQLVAQYGPAVDSGSAETTAGLWTEDGTFDAVGAITM